MTNQKLETVFFIVTISLAVAIGIGMGVLVALEA